MPPPSGPPIPGQQPTPEQIRMMQQQMAAEAAKRGLTVPQYIEQLKAQAMQQHQAQQAQAQAQQQKQQQQQGGQQPVHINPGPPNPAALAVANFLRAQELKPRTCLLDEKRRDMFRVKRAIRALQSPAYEKARSKNPLLPEVTDRASAENAFKLLPLSLLSLRVSKVDAGAGHEGHNHAKPKKVKGLWTVRVEQHQETNDDDHYVWFYEGSQWKQKLYAAGALLLVIAVVMFPLWPLVMRQGVWYLSMGMLGLIGLFFAMAIFRLILFVVTMFTVPPGLWLYPNLFEDVGFFDSFRPVWAWHETPEQKKAKKKSKKSKSKAAKAASDPVSAVSTIPANGKPVSKQSSSTAATGASAPVTPVHHATGASPGVSIGSAATQRLLHARVEEVDED